MMARGKGPTVSIKDLVLAMHDVIAKGNRNTKDNVKEVAQTLGLAPETVQSRIRKAKFEYPHVRLLDLSYFVRNRGPRTETYTDEELDTFFAELLKKPVKEIQSEVEDARAEIEEDLEDLANRAPRKKRTVRAS